MSAVEKSGPTQDTATSEVETPTTLHVGVGCIVFFMAGILFWLCMLTVVVARMQGL